MAKDTLADPGLITNILGGVDESVDVIDTEERFTRAAGVFPYFLGAHQKLFGKKLIDAYPGKKIMSFHQTFNGICQYGYYLQTNERLYYHLCVAPVDHRLNFALLQTFGVDLNGRTLDSLGQVGGISAGMAQLTKDTAHSCVFDFPDRPNRPIPPPDVTPGDPFPWRPIDDVDPTPSPPVDPWEPPPLPDPDNPPDPTDPNPPPSPDDPDDVNHPNTWRGYFLNADQVEDEWWVEGPTHWNDIVFQGFFIMKMYERPYGDGYRWEGEPFVEFTNRQMANLSVTALLRQNLEEGQKFCFLAHTKFFIESDQGINSYDWIDEPGLIKDRPFGGMHGELGYEISFNAPWMGYYSIPESDTALHVRVYEYHYLQNAKWFLNLGVYSETDAILKRPKILVKNG